VLATEEVEDEEREEDEEGYSKYTTDDSTDIGGFIILGWSVANF
jgi:hypothetical protein